MRWRCLFGHDIEETTTDEIITRTCRRCPWTKRYCNCTVQRCNQFGWADYFVP